MGVIATAIIFIVTLVLIGVAIWKDKGGHL